MDSGIGTQNASALLTEAAARLDRGDRDGAARLLCQARAHPATRLAAHNLMEQHALPGGMREMFGLDCRISPRDDIYRFFDGHPTSTNPLRDYLADGWRTLSELMLLLERAQRPLLSFERVLEFASGHGRFTRHLARAMGPQRVEVSDVVADAVEFSCNAFGVQGFVSSADPTELRWSRRYDLVFVLSLFSHLPVATWEQWLQHLWQAVAPGGALVFSTHGAEAVRRAGVTLDARGYFFAPSSESQAIDPQSYGTAFTNEAFVRRAVAALEPRPLAPLQFAPAWFWHHQDAWLVQRMA